MCMKILWSIYYCNRFIESIWISFFRFENTVKRIRNRIEFLDEFPMVLFLDMIKIEI